MASSAESIRPNDLYKFERVPLGQGSYARVMLAEHRGTGHRVALKQAFNRRDARLRIEREIEVQARLSPHPNIMPILDHDPGLQWYTMPIALGALKELYAALSEDDLAAMLVDIAHALDVAHGEQFVHRDVSPGNILAFEASKSTKSKRWVIADWGMVSRPYGPNSLKLTKTGQGVGTRGFDAPELDEDPSNATAAADVYGLGRIAAWVLTGQYPKAREQLLPGGDRLRWRTFVKQCTDENVASRVQNMPDLVAALERVFAVEFERPAVTAGKLLRQILSGDVSCWDQLVQLALDHADDADLHLDYLVRVPTPLVRGWARGANLQAEQLVVQIGGHLKPANWGDRDEQYVNTPLSFMRSIMEELFQFDEHERAYDAAEAFMQAELQWSVEAQRRRTLEWMADLTSPHDVVVARVLAGRPLLVEYYRSDKRMQSPALHAVLNVDRASHPSAR